MTSISEPTIVDADLGITLRTAVDGTVILAGRPSEDGEWHFTPDEARRFGGALLRHSGQGGAFASLFEDDAVYMYGPSRQPWAPTEDTEGVAR